MNKIKRVWIVGFGKFGRHSARQVEKIAPGASVVAIDPDKEGLRSWEGRQTLVCSDGAEFVCDRLDSGERPDMIVPALPVHLAYEYVRRRMNGRRRVLPLPVSETGVDRLPNPVSGPDGEIYVSHADFVCPDTCAEPADRCTETGSPRKQDMFELLGKLTGDFTPVVVRSRQLAPGVGGYSPEPLVEAAGRVEQLSGTVLLATACRCHGVVHAFRIV